MNDKEKLPMPGEWWECSKGRRYLVHDMGGPPLYVQERLGTKPAYWFGYKHIDEVELNRHLPGCTGWDWEEPTNE
jgi:hypothetical protein